MTAVCNVHLLDDDGDGSALPASKWLIIIVECFENSLSINLQNAGAAFALPRKLLHAWRPLPCQRTYRYRLYVWVVAEWVRLDWHKPRSRLVFDVHRLEPGGKKRLGISVSAEHSPRHIHIGLHSSRVGLRCWAVRGTGSGGCCCCTKLMDDLLMDIAGIIK